MKKEATMGCIGYPAACMPWGQERTDDYFAFSHEMERILWNAYRHRGVRSFVCGVTDGMELYFAEAVAKLEGVELVLMTAVYPQQIHTWANHYTLLPSVYARWDNLLQRDNVRFGYVNSRNPDNFTDRQRVHNAILKQSQELLSCIGRRSEWISEMDYREALAVERAVAWARRKNLTVHRICTLFARPLPHELPMGPEIPFMRVTDMELTRFWIHGYTVLAQATVVIREMLVITGIRLVTHGFGVKVLMPWEYGAPGCKNSLRFANANARRAIQILIYRAYEAEILQRQIRL